MKIKDRAKPKTPPVEPGVYMAVCVGVVDLGEQYSEKFKNYSNKVKFVWALPSETIEIDGNEEERQLSKEFTFSISKKGGLRSFLESWNGKTYSDDDFAELDVFEQLGIALMVVGAAGLATVATLNWSSIPDSLRGPAGKTTALISGALLALGAAVAFSGVMLPLGIALMAAGAIGLVTVTALNWDAVTSALQGPIGKTVALVSGVLLVLGAVLAFSGINLPLGIALIAAGAVGLVTVSALNWNAILEYLKGAWEDIKLWWNQNVAPKLTLSFWQGKFSSIAQGLVSKIKDGINSGIALFNQFIRWINSKMSFSWGDWSIGGKKIINAGSFQLLNIPQIPYLAKGAVIPPNREFLAVLGDQKHGTNIEAPLETIQQALANVLASQGESDVSVTVNFTGDLAQLAKILKPEIDYEARRRGPSLAKG